METIGVEVDGRGVARIVLARPGKHNALSAQMIAELTEAAGRLGRDPSVRVVVLAAQGTSFCAGADLGWMKAQMAADAAARAKEATRLAMMLRALDCLPKPLIGAVQGNAFGGGIGLMSVCDQVVAVETACFGLTEVRLGLVPATIGPYVVARMGAGAVRRVFFSGRVFDAAEAGRLGLVGRVVPEAALEAAVEAEVAPYLSAAPAAVARAKALVRRLGVQIDDAAVAASVDALVAAWEGDEAHEGVAAFFEKRSARWAVLG